MSIIDDKFIATNGGSGVDTIIAWEQILKDNPNININTQSDIYSDNTALIIQADIGTKEAMEWLLTRDPGANPNLQNRSGETALMRAIINKDIAKVKLLLDYSADRNIKNINDDTPLSFAQKFNMGSIVDLLKNYYPEKRNNSNDRKRVNDEQVQRVNNKKFVENLIKDSPGDTIAVWNVKLSNGLVNDINVQSSTWNNHTALINQTYRNGSNEAIKWLLTRTPPADPNIQDNSGGTALYYAVVHDDLDKVRLLIDHGADRNIKTNIDTPLSYAKRENKKPEIIELLENYYPNSPNAIGGGNYKSKYLKYKNKYLQLKNQNKF